MESSYGNPDNGKQSEFTNKAPEEVIAMAEIAVEAGLNSEMPLVFSADFPFRSIIGTLVLDRAGVKKEEIFQGKLTDDQVDNLAKVLSKIAESKLMIQE